MNQGEANTQSKNVKPGIKGGYLSYYQGINFFKGDKTAIFRYSN